MRINRSRSKSRHSARRSAVAVAIGTVLSCVGPDCFAVEDSLAQLAATASARRITALESVVNGQPQGLVFVLVENNKAIAIETGALRRWRVKVPPEAAFQFEDHSFTAVSNFPGAVLSMGERTQQIFLTLPPTAFDREEVQFGSSSDPPLSPTPLAGFLNYTLFGYTSSASSYGSGFFEVGASGDFGSIISTASANTVGSSGQTTEQIVRFDTAWRYDDRTGLRTWNVGDSFTQAGVWGQSVRFGGVQYGTNFQLQPTLITYPLQPFSGTAIVPSTVDVFVNGGRIASQSVPPGPFTLNDVPLVSGAGDVQLVVRDPFGQQQIITQPFYASRRLLRAGLDEFQWSVGAIRENYGLTSFDYGSAFASGYWRRGVTDRLTVEVRAEADDDVRAGGATADFSTGLAGIVTAGAALSGGQAGSGHLWIAGYEYQGRFFNFNARSAWASSQFRSIGEPSVTSSAATVAGVGRDSTWDARGRSVRRGPHSVTLELPAWTRRHCPIRQR